MKCLYFLLFVAVAQGNPAKLKAPQMTRLTAQNGPSFRVDWKPVQSDEPRDPVVGYKVYVWEVEPTIVQKKEIIDGVETLVERVESQEISGNNKPLITKPKEYLIDKTSFTFKDVKLNVIYEIRVKAYTANIEGPLSDAMRIRMHGNKKLRNKKTKKPHKGANKKKSRIFY